jgi:hypothetical protein
MLDEAQDTSESQLALVTKLAPRGVTAITAVGDADQTIVSRWDGPNLALPSPNPWVWMWWTHSEHRLPLPLADCLNPCDPIRC